MSCNHKHNEKCANHQHTVQSMHVKSRAGAEQRRHRASTRIVVCLAAAGLDDSAVTFRDDKDAAE